ncbi:dethiobiotin synthase [Acetobacter orientalis]|uniref:dethiobiotin synthase n=2 Tax=Acetobacter orientalis TaxID=146474 RepID=UPI0039EB35C6
MDTLPRQNRIRQSFDSAAQYDTAATMQQVAARQLFAQICTKLGTKAPARILEIGCGTGFLTQLLHERWPQATLIATDIAPHMLKRTAQRVGDAVQYAVLDAASPDIEGPFDLICGNLVFQWLEQPKAVLARLAGLLAPGGVLALSTLLEGTFAEWQAACAPHESGVPYYPSQQLLADCVPPLCSGKWQAQTAVQPFASAHAFLRHLKQTGAAVPRAGYSPLPIAALRHAMQRFDANGHYVSWQFAYGCFQRPVRAGVFVTGTDTGVGKTFVSACLVKAWNALYWKPLQSGLAEEEGDTATVAHLAGCAPTDITPPVGAFQAPLSPEAAAQAEGQCINVQQLKLPSKEPMRPLVVEGAGGLMVPVAEQVMMIDLVVAWGLPVVLVARSGLGTLNHTLLSVEALKQRGVALMGVILNGPRNPGNKQAIEHKGGVRILAEIAHQPYVTPDAVQAVTDTLPKWEETLWQS